jgi:transposase-like protein
VARADGDEERDGARTFLRKLVARVVREDSRLLVVPDAAKGFRVAVREVLSAAAVLQRR